MIGKFSSTLFGFPELLCRARSLFDNRGDLYEVTIIEDDVQDDDEDLEEDEDVDPDLSSDDESSTMISKLLSYQPCRVLEILDFLTFALML